MKRHKLPVKPYLKKYLAAQLTDGVLKCEKRIVRVTTNAHDVHSYFERNKTNPHFIYVEMRESSLYTLFGLYVDLCNEFRHRIFSVMAFAKKNNLAALDAARQFLQEFNIEDDECKLESIYRTWERKKQRYLQPTVPVLRKKKERAIVLEPSIQLDLFPTDKTA